MRLDVRLLEWKGICREGGGVEARAGMCDSATGRVRRGSAPGAKEAAKQPHSSSHNSVA